MEDTISQTRSKRSLTYQDAGVDIDAGNRLVEKIKPLTKSTARAGTNASIGGFGGVFDLKAAGFEDPLLVSTTDGVGTKLRLAIDAARHDTVGIDLVAMCVNDLVAQGAEPLYFLDYYATGKLSVDTAREVVVGIAKGCQLAGCALIGGETAEMPGMYIEGDYDLAGFAVGAVERGDILDRTIPKAGDLVLGLESSGIHSNGLALVRHVIERVGLPHDAPCPFAPEKTISEILLTPTRIYAKSCLPAIRTRGVTGVAHITGGGLVENPPRCFSDKLTARIDCATWPLPLIFRWLLETGGIVPNELVRTFNCGIGIILTVSPNATEAITGILTDHGEIVHRIGVLEAREPNGPSVILNGLSTW